LPFRIINGHLGFAANGTDHSTLHAASEDVMQVAQGVEMLELPATLMDGPGVLCPALLWDGEEVILVDAGLPGMTRQFIEAMTRVGIQPDRLSRVILTHHDLDHIGSLGELQRAVPRHVDVMAHADEVPYIQGERRPIKMTPELLAKMEEQMKGLPEERRTAMRAMNESWKNLKLKVDRTLGDGEVLPYFGEIQVIHTPGHTPGHICLYLRASKTLIAGDALFVEGGKLAPAPPFINADTPMALASLKKLTRYDIANIICYHGGLFRDDCNRRLAELT
jgi:glyoxylase-like metal-dependent hydrolase (beta-lactamase superfamily II)